jgi:repressor LexA
MPNDHPMDTKLKQVRKFFERVGRMPSYSEMADMFGYKSKNAVHYLVNGWKTRGLLSDDGRGRLLPGKLLGSIRLLGTVEAGFPTPAEEENVDAITLDDWLITNKEASYLLRVSGESMIEAGIMPGDTVILERGRAVKNGDIVIANVDGDWTMKFYEKRGKKIVLMPANVRFSPIEPKGELQIAGVVTAVIRKLHA